VKDSSNQQFVLFLAVLPAYRRECIQIIRGRLGAAVKLYVSDAHLDATVKTGIPEEYYQRVSMIRLFRNRAFVQLTSSPEILTADSVIVDLNPRSLTAWWVLLVRKVLARRTLVWGHIHPQAGIGARSARLRIAMRKLAQGTISYTYTDMKKAQLDLPGSAVWVAPNALYRKNDMVPLTASPEVEKNEILYVGRFVDAKKVGLLVQGFAGAARSNASIRLRLIGGGQAEESLRELVSSLGLSDRVSFDGWVDGVEMLRSSYSRAFCSVSPGFAGLGLTQSLGFGVPMIVADAEPHSPEIELAESGGVTWFESDSPEGLADAIARAWAQRDGVPNVQVSEYTRSRYSAEAMADGIVDALLAHDQCRNTTEAAPDDY